MISEHIIEQLSDEALILDGYDHCVVGVGSVFPHTDLVLIYSVAKIIEELMSGSGMDYEEAQEFYDFNIAGAYMGEGTPILMADKIVDTEVV